MLLVSIHPGSVCCCTDNDRINFTFGIYNIGSGKTTIMNTLLRLYPYSREDSVVQGSIKYDGIELYNVPKPFVRGRGMYVIPQETVLLSGTLRFNLDPEGSFSDMQILEAVKKSGLYDSLASYVLTSSKKSNGLSTDCAKRDIGSTTCTDDIHQSTLVGSAVLELMISPSDFGGRGQKGDSSCPSGSDSSCVDIGLSQGQKQLLCICRLFLQQARTQGNWLSQDEEKGIDVSTPIQVPLNIVLLDEVTSAMDATSRILLKQSLLSLLCDSDSHQSNGSTHAEETVNRNTSKHPVTLLMIVHKLEDALGLCTHVLELAHGKVVYYGPIAK